MSLIIEKEEIQLPTNYDDLSWRERRLVRERYVELQNGRCLHCKELLSKQPDRYILETPVTESLYPDGFFTRPIHLHHNHDTGLTIGAVHARCNAVLWEHFGE